MPIYHIKKVPSKIIYLGYSVNIIRSFWPEPDPDYKPVKVNWNSTGLAGSTGCAGIVTL